MSTIRDTVLLLTRLGLALVMSVHGWQKVQQGFGATAEGFAGMGIPLPEVAAGVAIAVELGGAVLLVLGLLTPVVGVAIALVMAGAFWFTHRGTTVLVSEGGFELVLVIGLLALLLAVVGAGRLSADHVVAGRSRNRRKGTMAG